MHHWGYSVDQILVLELCLKDDSTLACLNRADVRHTPAVAIGGSEVAQVFTAAHDKRDNRDLCVDKAR